MNMPIPTAEPEETASARVAREKRDDAERKREERKRRKAQGRPDTRLLDHVIVDALRKAVVQPARQGGLPSERPVATRFEIADVVRLAAADLTARGFKGKRIVEALASRLA